MASFTITKQIAASPEKVFSVATDFAHAAEHIDGIDEMHVLTDGSIGVGTRISETRTMMNRSETQEFEITAFDPGKSFTMEATSCGCKYICTHRFISDNGGTRMELQTDTKAITFFAKLMTPVGFLMTGFMKKMIDKDLEDLKISVENNQ